MSSFSQMGRVAGDWINTAGTGLLSLSFPVTPMEIDLPGFFKLEGIGGGAEGAKGKGGGGPLLDSFLKQGEGGSAIGGGFLGSGEDGLLFCDGRGGGRRKPRLESCRWETGTGGGG